jgi:hypothetical protein
MSLKNPAALALAKLLLKGPDQVVQTLKQTWELLSWGQILFNTSS